VMKKMLGFILAAAAGWWLILPAAALAAGPDTPSYPPLGPSKNGRPLAAVHCLASGEEGKIRLAAQILAPGATLEAIRIDNVTGEAAAWRSDGGGEAGPLTVASNGRTLADGRGKMNFGPLGQAEEILALTLADNDGAFKDGAEFRVTFFMAGGARAFCLLKAADQPVSALARTSKAAPAAQAAEPQKANPQAAPKAAKQWDDNPPDVWKAAEQGDPRAQFIRGVDYELGDGQDAGSFQAREAAAWYRKAAEQGDVEAQFALGQMYYYGREVDWGGGQGKEQSLAKDEREAVAWWRKAAEQGHAKAQAALKAAPKAAPDWEGWFEYRVQDLRQKAEQGYVPAQYKLSELYVRSGDQGQALAWRRKAAEQGNLVAQMELAVEYYSGQNGDYGCGINVDQDYAEAAAWFRLAANQGDAGAQYKLGSMYAKGEGLAKDAGEAAAWYRKAADQGDAEAQYALGNMYAKGEGVAKDAGEAVAWWCKATERGEAQAQEALGNMYAKGEGAAKDLKRAEACYRKAEEREAERKVQDQIENAKFNYHSGLLYERGDDEIRIAKDLDEAVRLYRLAAEQGNEDAKAALIRLGK